MNKYKIGENSYDRYFLNDVENTLTRLINDKISKEFENYDMEDLMEIIENIHYNPEVYKEKRGIYNFKNIKKKNE